ncbi:MAG: CehA/McbA family metallohydrolase [Gaiellaceae bacterium]
MPGPVDLACVVHCHSTYSDGTGTVPEIAAGAARAGADAVLLTDHDTLAAKRRGEERWYGEVLVCVGEEVSPVGANHYLAFGLDEVIDPGLPPADVHATVRAAGGIGFLAHPFSKGSERFRRAGMPTDELGGEDYTGIELWSWVTDTAERLESVADALRFIVAPERMVDDPPAANLAAWDELLRRRPIVALGGIDAHQIGIRVAGRVPLRLMSYARSFRHLRTHVLLDEPVNGETGHDRDAIYAALAAGRCYLAIDSIAPARGFSFAAAGEAPVAMGSEGPLDGGRELVARVPRPASLIVVHEGRPVATASGTELRHRAEEPGAWRVQASLPAFGRQRTWIVSNPVYLRA